MIWKSATFGLLISALLLVADAHLLRHSHLPKLQTFGSSDDNDEQNHPRDRILSGSWRYPLANSNFVNFLNQESTEQNQNSGYPQFPVNQVTTQQPSNSVHISTANVGSPQYPANQMPLDHQTQSSATPQASEKLSTRVGKDVYDDSDGISIIGPAAPGIAGKPLNIQQEVITPKPTYQTTKTSIENQLENSSATNGGLIIIDESKTTEDPWKSFYNPNNKNVLGQVFPKPEDILPSADKNKEISSRVPAAEQSENQKNFQPPNDSLPPPSTGSQVQNSIGQVQAGSQIQIQQPSGAAIQPQYSGSQIQIQQPLQPQFPGNNQIMTTLQQQQRQLQQQQQIQFPGNQIMTPQQQQQQQQIQYPGNQVIVPQQQQFPIQYPGNQQTELNSAYIDNASLIHQRPTGLLGQILETKWLNKKQIMENTNNKLLGIINQKLSHHG